MNRNESPRNGYEPPTIKPARSSLDLDLDEADLRQSADGLRQELEQIEFEESSSSANSSRSILNNRFSKHISSFTSLLLFHLLLLGMTRGNQLWPSTCTHNQLRLLGRVGLRVGLAGRFVSHTHKWYLLDQHADLHISIEVAAAILV
jgi:hypothetical protein